MIGESLDLSDQKEATLWAGLCLAFFFLLRSSEYCVADGVYSADKALQVGDVRFFLKGTPTDNWEEADELVLFIRSSKTDQAGEGALRNAYATGTTLCPVKAAARVMRLRQAAGAGDGDPFLSWTTGYLKRDQVTSILRWAAKELGQPEALYASHSLRIGGASTMLAEGYSEEDIRRQGRWHSYCWRRYAYDSRERMLGVAAAMAKSTYTVMTAGQDFVARRRGAGSGGGKPPSGSPCQSGRRV